MGRIALHGLRKSFGQTEVIRGVDLAIAEGEMVVFVGPSGSGKSTLLRLIAGLEKPDGGRIEIDGRDVTTLEPVDRRLAMVFQSYALYPHMSVRGNMAFALETAGRPRAEIEVRVSEAARILQLGALMDRRPAQLSGGQRQRVAIGRAIVREPLAFLFDEPLSNLDAGLRAETRLEIARLHRDLGTTMVYVTHDQIEAMTLADRIVVLDGGIVRQAGTPETLYEKPADLFVAGFIGSPRMNLLPVRVLDDGTVSIADGPPLAFNTIKGVPVQAGLRAEHLHLVAPEDGTLSGIVRDVEYLGADASVFVDLGSSVVAVRTTGARRPVQGEAVGLAFVSETLHLFDATGHRLN